MIPLGILGNRRGAGAAAGAYELISSTVLSSTATSVTFSSLPTGYQHLQLRLVVNADVTGTMRMRFNGDTGANYGRHILSGNGSTVSSGASTGQTEMEIHYNYGNSWSSGIYDILDYASTTKNKVFRGLGGVSNTTSVIRLMSGLWLNTAALTSLTVKTPDGGYNFAIGSRFSLYGIKG